ncbi:Cupredoxin, partial [Mycena capillaripes]
MRFSLAVVALAPILSVYADNILIQVGANNQLIFSPSNVTAKVGDTIAFQFQSKNHSLTQSTFAAPCTKNGPVDSSFQFVPAGSTQLPQFSFNVTDTTPLWFFCAQTNPVSHCGQGMVFSVNADPNSAKSHAAFQALA